MALHLEEISCVVTPGAHAVVLLDQAGWHTSDKLSIPDNMTLMPLPAKSPELNPVENVWQFLRDNWLSNRVFDSHRDILDHCCFAWNNLVDQPWRIMSIGMRDWAISWLALIVLGSIRELYALVIECPQPPAKVGVMDGNIQVCLLRRAADARAAARGARRASGRSECEAFEGRDRSLTVDEAGAVRTAHGF